MGSRGAVPILSQDAARRRVLARQHLLDRTRADGVVRVAEDLVGLHATSATTPYLSLHARIRGFATADLEDALYERRDLVRLKGMRGTVFLLPRRLAPLVFAATRAATLASDRRWLKANEQAYARLAPRVLEALAGRSLAVTELRQALGADPDLPGVVAMLCDEGLIVRDRPLGGRGSSTFRYRLWREAFPEVVLDEEDEATATRELVRRYADGFGPVSRADVMWWTGLPARRIDAAVRALGDELAPVSVAGLGDGLLVTPAALAETAMTAEEAGAVDLLPMLDPYTMGYRDRTRFLDPHLDDVIVDRGGNATSVVLVDGRVVGVWDLAQQPGPAVRVLLFDAGHRDRRRILDRAAETAAFWFGGPAPVVEFESMTPLRQRSGVMRRPLDGAIPRRPAPRQGPRAAVQEHTAATVSTPAPVAEHRMPECRWTTARRSPPAPHVNR